MTSLICRRRRICQKERLRLLMISVLYIMAVFAITNHMNGKIEFVQRDYDEFADQLRITEPRTDCTSGDCEPAVIPPNIQAEDIIPKQTFPDTFDGNTSNEINLSAETVNGDREIEAHDISDGNPLNEVNSPAEIVNDEKENKDVYYLMMQRSGGRMGNQMFDFACSLGIARTLGYKYLMRKPHPLLNFYEIDQPTAEPDSLTNVMYISQLEWRNETFRNSKIWVGHNLTLSGHHRKWRDFQYIKDEVRKSLTIKPQFLNQALDFLRNNTPQNSTVIGVHVRRGDFISNESVGWGRTIADISYLRKAMNYFRNRFSNAFFVVASDDKPWCKENLAADDTVFSPFVIPAVDMGVLSHCNHNVITSGTFGWWGAWLTNGTVVYFKDFPEPGSVLEETILFRDEYYPPHWIGMGNGEEE